MPRGREDVVLTQLLYKVTYLNTLGPGAVGITKMFRQVKQYRFVYTYKADYCRMRNFHRQNIFGSVWSKNI